MANLSFNADNLAAHGFNLSLNVHMNKLFSHKLFEIFFEKALIALILLLAGYLTNQSLERYKLIEVQRVAGTTAFVSACQDIWSKVYEYENTVNEETSVRSHRMILKMLRSKNLKDNDDEIEKNKKLEEQQLADLKRLTNEREFIIGHKLVMHFWQYAGFVKARANAKIDAEEKSGYEAKISQDAVVAYDKQIASMRFTSDMAREYAISQLPH